MTKNLETADLIVKLALAVMIVVLYLTHVIQGPFADVLLALSTMVLGITIAKVVYALIIAD